MCNRMKDYYITGVANYTSFGVPTFEEHLSNNHTLKTDYYPHKKTYYFSLRLKYVLLWIL